MNYVCCAYGSRGNQRPSLAYYVSVTGAHGRGARRRRALMLPSLSPASKILIHLAPQTQISSTTIGDAMRRIKAILLVTLSLVMFGCTQSPRQQAPPYPSFSNEGVGAQNRVGRYLQDSVVSSAFRTCWGRLQGEGAIAMDLTYRKLGSGWAFDTVKVTKSALPQGQDAVAQRCVEESARSTMFPVDSKEGLETAAPEFIVRLGWPVPLPAEGADITSDQMARMIGTGGVITVPGCSDCVSNPQPPYGLKCEAKGSGSNVDCEEISSNVCATTPKACLRGVFGGTRGVIMY